jgi:hypothetical protein
MPVKIFSCLGVGSEKIPLPWYGNENCLDVLSWVRFVNARKGLVLLYYVRFDASG